MTRKKESVQQSELMSNESEKMDVIPEDNDVSEENTVVEENPVEKRLSSALEETFKEIQMCDSQIEEIEAEASEKISKLRIKKENLEAQLDEALGSVQEKFGLNLKGVNKTSVQKKVEPRQSEKDRQFSDMSVRDLILTYLQANKTARSIDIRQFLLANGKKTNPGVELSRLIKTGTIKNLARGVYTMR